LGKWATKPRDDSLRNRDLQLKDSDYKRDEFGAEFVKEYINTYSRFQWNTPHIAQATMHLIMGQVPSIKSMKIYKEGNYLDTRIHINWFQQQATGKGQGYNFVGMVCDGIGINMKAVVEFTDAGLVGGFKDRKVFDPKVKSYDIEKVFTPGVLHPDYGANIVASNEASVLFDSKGTRYRQNSLNYLQIVMNTLGTKDNCLPKDVLGGNENIYSDVSLFMSSYIPERLLDVFLKSGYMSRCLTIINDVKFGDRIKSMFHASDHFNKKSVSAFENFDDIVNKFNFINQYYKDMPNLKTHPSVITYEKRLVGEIIEPIKNIEPFHREKLGEFIDRVQDMCWKVMYHSACLRLSDTIEREDVAYAGNFMMPIWKSFASFIEDALEKGYFEKRKTNEKESSVIRGIAKLENLTNVDGYVPKSEIIKIVAKDTGKSENTVRRWITDCIDTGLLNDRIYRKEVGLKVIGKRSQPW